MLSRACAVASILFLSACASAGGDYDVIRKNAEIGFGSSVVTGYRGAPDGSLVLDVRQARFYRAVLEPKCRSLVGATPSIDFLGGAASDVKAGAYLGVAGERCRILQLDEIKRPG
jgi:hypothetical protein